MLLLYMNKNLTLSALFVFLCQLKDDAVSLVDVLAPTDFILNSPIGNADGQVKIFNKVFVLQ